MQIKQLTVSNCFCFGADQKLVFLEPVYQVIGERAGTENQSNGVGKSSLYYVIQEVLFGKNLKKTLKEFTGNIFTDPNSYAASVTFETKGKTYEVTLSRKKGKVTLKVLEDGDDISKHTVPDTYKMIEQIIGIDYELFTMLTYLSPTISTPNILFLGTPKEKKDIFTKLFNLEQIIKVIDKATEENNKLKSEIKTITDKLSAFKSIVIPEEPDPKLGGQLLEQTKEKSEKIDKLKRQLEDYNELYEKLKYWKEIYSKRDELRDYIHNNPKIEFESPRSFQTKYIQAKEALATLISKERELSNATEVCPVCRRKIDGYEHIRAEAEVLQERIRKGRTYIDELERELKRLQELERKDTFRLNTVLELQRIEDQLENESIQFDKAEDLEEIPTKRAMLSAELLTLNDEYRKIQTQRDELLRLEASIQYAKTLEAAQEIERKELETKLNAATEESKPLGIISEYLGFSGFLTARIKAMAESLTSIINEYLNILSNGSLVIRFIPSDKLIFTLLKDNKELPINNLSAGQLTMLQLSSILALRDLVNANKGITIDLLVLDELFGTLDEIRRGILIDIMRDISVRGNQHILSISHLYTDTALPTITVVQRDGITEILQ